MTRDEVYAAVDSERAYQDKMSQSESRPDMVPNLDLGATLTAMRHILTMAEGAWYHGSGNHPTAMEFVRKITALGVKAGEQYGMTKREGF